MTIYLYRDRPWTDDDSLDFLDDPGAMKLDAASVRGHDIVIANDCKTGRLLADVIDVLKSFGATKIILKSARPRMGVLGMVHKRDTKPS